MFASKFAPECLIQMVRFQFGGQVWPIFLGAFSRLVSFREGLVFKVAQQGGCMCYIKGHGTTEIEAVVPPLVVINVYMG